MAVWKVRVRVQGEGWLGETKPLAAEADAEGVEGMRMIGGNREKSNKAVNCHALVEARLSSRSEISLSMDAGVVNVAFRTAGQRTPS
jgi:hypothetical protein